MTYALIRQRVFRLVNILKRFSSGMLNIYYLQKTSDEPYASEIAKTIDSYQKSGMTIDTTSLLYKIIDKSLPHDGDSRRKDLINKTAAGVFPGYSHRSESEIRSSL